MRPNKPAFPRTKARFATQPVEEPENPEDLRLVFDCVGWDRILYSSDYPHWDFDDPRHAFRIPLSDAEQRMILHDNAIEFYQLKS